MLLNFIIMLYRYERSAFEKRSWPVDATYNGQTLKIACLSLDPLYMIHYGGARPLRKKECGY